MIRNNIYQKKMSQSRSESLKMKSYNHEEKSNMPSQKKDISKLFSRKTQKDISSTPSLDHMKNLGELKDGWEIKVIDDSFDNFD